MIVLGLDVGERRIGAAISDPDARLAVPIRAIERPPLRTQDASDSNATESIFSLVKEYSAQLVVVGMPISLSGEEGPQAKKTKRFSDKLAKALGVPVATWDERLSTVAASSALNSSGARANKKRKLLDSSAAAIILQSYLDSKRLARQD
jgi:putative Holliday junction resolvase